MLLTPESRPLQNAQDSSIKTKGILCQYFNLLESISYLLYVLGYLGVPQAMNVK
jgi:hypothetical protein